MPAAAPPVPLLRPDRSFVEAVAAGGGADLKKCFQCATCSVVCDLSTEEAPFPRREMLWAQWGLRDRLAADRGVWLCHQCGDCSERCPRGARPGDVLGAVRRQVVGHWAVPRAFSAWVNRPGGLLLMLAVPAVLLVLTVSSRDRLGEILGMEPHAAEGGFSYAAFFPHWLLVGFFSFFAALSTAAAAAGAVRFWRALEGERERAGIPPPAEGILPAAARVLVSFLRHDRFSRCGARASRRLSHMLLVYGFLALFGTTVWAVVDLYLVPMLGGEAGYPYGLLHPVKFLANAGAILLVAGAGRALLERVSGNGEGDGSTAFDLSFAGVILAVGLTGVVLEVLRFAAGEAPGEGFLASAHALYVFHLVLVFGLLMYLPYSKFAHVIYRTVALVHAERAGGTREGSRDAATACKQTKAEGPREKGGRS